MFLITWMFDKLGYMPKITVDTSLQAWPFPKTPEDKPTVKKPVAKKATTAAKKTTIVRTKKAK
jgi:hypothetical protein